MSEWTAVVGTVLGAGIGLAGGIISQRLNSKDAKQARRASYLKEQLHNLYGPLQLYMSLYDSSLQRVGELMKSASPDCAQLSTEEIIRTCKYSSDDTANTSLSKMN